MGSDVIFQADVLTRHPNKLFVIFCTSLCVPKSCSGKAKKAKYYSV